MLGIFMEVGTLITIITLGSIGVLFFIGFLRGLRKGFYKSLMDVGFMALSLIAAIFVAKTVTNYLADIEFMKELLNELQVLVPELESTISGILEYVTQFEENPEMINVVLALPAALLTPFFFIIVYLVVILIVKIPKIIIERIVVGKNGGSKYRGGSRFLGGLVALMFIEWWLQSRENL